MAVTGSHAIGDEQIQQQVERLLNSSLFQSSESLRRLLRYLANQAHLHPGASLKEYQIATEVFGRPADFDPRLDSTVRVQTGRLRGKLAEYYASVGVDDQVIVDIPKGAYALAAHARPHAHARPQEPGNLAPAPFSGTPPLVVDSPGFPTRAARQGAVMVALALFAVSSAGVAGYLWASRTAVAPHKEPSIPASLAALWTNFTQRGDNPIVVFSNAEFVGRPETGMRYLNPAKDKSPEILDHYTGTGEVVAVAELTRLLSSMDVAIRVKRGRLLSLDDAKNNDLILLGSPSENLVWRDLRTTTDFVFQNMGNGRKGDLAIVNVKPQSGEPKTFLASPSLPIREDYAVVALLPGLGTNRWTMALAGTTTIGTQAAAEFVTRASTVEDLFRRLGVGPGTQLPSFEAVLRVNVAGGVPVKSEIAALRRR